MQRKTVSRRAFLSTGGGALAATVLAACQSQPQIVKETVVVPGTPQVVKETVVAQPTAAPPKETVYLQWSWWGSVEQLERNRAKTQPFLDKFPHVVLEPVYMEGATYNTKILTMFAGATAPDVIMVNAYYAPDWFSKGLAADLGALLDKDAEAKETDWIPIFLEDMTFDGKLYGLPTDAGPMVWMYNTKIVGESGKPTPLEYYEQGKWTYDTVPELAQACTDAEKNVYFHNDFYAWNYWMAMAWAYGGEYFDQGETKCLVNSEPWITAVQYALDLKEKYEVMPPPGASAEMGLAFRSGNIAMMGCWPRQPTNRAAALGGTQLVQPCYVAAGPKGHKCITKSNSYCLCSMSKQMELGFELLKTLCGAEGEILEQKEFKYIFPATKKNHGDPAFWAMSDWDQNIQRISNDEHGHRLPITAKIPWMQMTATWTQYTDQVWMGKLTPAQCCANIANDIDALLEKAT